MFNQKELIAVLRFVSHAMARLDVRYFLNGIYFNIQNSICEIVATDGHRLAMVSMQLVGEVDDCSFIIHNTSILKMIQVFKTRDQLQTLTINVDMDDLERGTLTFNSTNKEAFRVLLIDGKFVDYKKVLKKTSGKPKAWNEVTVHPAYWNDTFKVLKWVSGRFSSVSVTSYGVKQPIKVIVSKDQFKFPSIATDPIVIIMPMSK